MNEQSKHNADQPTLWVVTELYYPEETSTGYYLTKIAESLTTDFSVRVICGQPNYSAKGLRAARREIHRGVEIFRVFGATLDKNKIPFRLYNMATLSVSIFSRMIRSIAKGDKILVVTTPPSLPLMAAAAALLKGASFILLIHDNYPEILIASGKVAPDSMIVKIAEHLNRWVYKYASKIIVVGRDMQKSMLKKTAGLDVPIETIPNWAELENVSPAARNDNRLLEELDLTDKFIFLYAGNMGYPNDLESIVWCAEKLLEEKQFYFHFIFLGAGVKKKWLEKICETKKLINITILEPRPRRQQTEFLNACDVALVSLVSGMLGVSMPSRTYNILASGKPILGITENESELAKVVEEENIGWTTPPGDPPELLKTIQQIYASRDEIEDMRIRARTAAISKYSETEILRQYQKSLN